ncbi:MAG: flagellar hook-associated protein 1 FlgK [Myxococcota bacterium]|jgi:flagellar hook-associated protein 1 FlgK
MAGLFGTLDISSRALQVNQRGLAITGHNIANVNTPGYTRQRQELESAVSTQDGSGHIGNGVNQRTINRINDTFLQARLIQEHSSYGSLQSESSVVGQLDALYNEQFGDGITPQLSKLYDAFGDLANASTPGQIAERGALVGIAQSVTTTFNRFDTQMGDLQRSTDRAIVGILPEVNGLLDRIATLNSEIAKSEVVAPANDLRDEQERLIRELASKIEITTLESNSGMTTVLFEGGIPLVEGQRASSLVAVADPTNVFDPTFSSVHVQIGNESIDITDRIRGGELGGMLISRDVHIADAIRELDALAYTLVQTVNEQHNLGAGLVDGSSNDFFSLDSPGTVEGSAGELRVADVILADSGNIAAGGGPGPALLGDVTNAAELARLRDVLSPSYAAGDVLGTPTGVSQSVIQQSANMISARGRAAELVDFSLRQQERVLNEVEDRRDQVSAVSLDEEVTDLIRLQASFQANARVISTINEMLNELVNVI